LERAILRQDPSLDLSATPLRDARLGGKTTSEMQARRRRWVSAGLAVLLGLGFVAATALTLVLVNDHAAPAAAPENAGIESPPLTTTVRPTPGVGRPHVRNHSAKSVTVKQIAPTTPRATSATATGPTPLPITNSGTTRHARPSTTRKVKTTHPASTTPKTSTPTTSTAKPPPPKPVTISDTFDSDFLDPLVWGGIVRTDNNVSIAEAGGQLQITVGAEAQPAVEHLPAGDSSFIDTHIGTACTFPGDFDARVDYTLLEWPLGDGVFAQLNSAGAGGAVGRESLPSGEEYQSWIYPRGSVGSASLPDTSGSLRIARVNMIETTYLLHHGSWTALARGYSSGEATPVLGMMTSDSPDRPFGHLEAKVAFDNFTITGANPTCLPSSRSP
ncbi:MAG: hypothetical protein QOJ66_2457, partial [Ilumatobacteraceae bacterium]